MFFKFFQKQFVIVLFVFVMVTPLLNARSSRSRASAPVTAPDTSSTNFVAPKSMQEFARYTQAGKPYVIYINMEGCPACKAAYPHITASAAANPQVTFIKVSPHSFGIEEQYPAGGYPTFLFFDTSGAMVYKMTGFQNEFVSKVKEISTPQATKAITTPAVKSTLPATPPQSQPIMRRAPQMQARIPQQVPQPQKMEVREEQYPMQRVMPAQIPAQQPAETPVKSEEPTVALSNFIDLNNEQEYHTALKSGKGIVLDFYTTWCGPCKAMVPFIQRAAQRMSSVTFIKINAEKFPQLKPDDLKGYPHFVFIKDTRKESFTGAGDENFFKMKLDSFFGPCK